MPNRTRMNHCLAASVLAVLGGASAATSQTPAANVPPLLDQVSVRVVNVDVSVTDKAGVPVSGLTRDDFVVYEDGRRQEIANFYAIEHTRVRAESDEVWRELEQDSPFRRRVVLLVDNNTLSIPERNRALEGFHEFLDTRFDQSYDWAVITVGADVRVLQPLTNDKVLVRAALDRIRSMPTNQSRYAAERTVLNDPVRTRMAQRSSRATQTQAGIAPVDSGGDAMTTALLFQSQLNMYRSLEATLRTVEAMTQAFQAYGQLDGKKMLVMLTGGIQMRPEYAFLMSPSESARGPARGQQDPPIQDPKLYQLYLGLRHSLDDASRSANAAGFTIHPVKATGLELQSPQLDVGFRASGATFSDGASVSTPELDDADSGQLMLAAATGGLYLRSNRVLESFETIDAQSSAFYSLGYTPSHAEDGRYHHIRVEVRHPGLEVRARKGYVDLSTEQKLELYLASPLTFAKTTGSLPVELEVETGDAGDVLATAILPMSSIRFFPRNGQQVGRVYVYLSIYDDDGEMVELVRKVRDLSFPSDRSEEALARELRYGLRFQLPTKNRYTVTVTLRDELTNEIGTAFSEVRL